VTAKTSEEYYLPLSGLQHFVFCARQCALIHVEGWFTENHLTLEGRLVHQPVSMPSRRRRGEKNVETDVWLRSDRLRLVGLADRIEVRRGRGRTEFVPVESKRARRRSFEADSVQLCAQAMALEEMRGVAVPRGEIYYVRQRRRVAIEINAALRSKTETAAAAYHAVIGEGRMPPGRFDEACGSCSLRPVCVPAVVGDHSSVRRYLAHIIHTD
jgi:CRISPR-associated exonuclease Cas4